MDEKEAGQKLELIARAGAQRRMSFEDRKPAARVSLEDIRKWEAEDEDDLQAGDVAYAVKSGFVWMYWRGGATAAAIWWTWSLIWTTWHHALSTMLFVIQEASRSTRQ